ncbi:hypothetical protein BpHYR1_013842 [Brachionus plicatilis]|uniref:Uncharacterized protein n=1 Tax=Brachionus plicatilis TaxID=10195 RepID=A0A3M7QD53_BRAPC|nr:hypothetical protein BpHYR1_013842 [Brachionus plicatilis]
MIAIDVSYPGIILIYRSPISLLEGLFLFLEIHLFVCFVKFYKNSTKRNKNLFIVLFFLKFTKTTSHFFNDPVQYKLIHFSSIFSHRILSVISITPFTKVTILSKHLKKNCQYFQSQVTIRLQGLNAGDTSVITLTFFTKNFPSNFYLRLKRFEHLKSQNSLFQIKLANFFTILVKNYSMTRTGPNLRDLNQSNSIDSKPHRQKRLMLKHGPSLIAQKSRDKLRNYNESYRDETDVQDEYERLYRLIIKKLRKDETLLTENFEYIVTRLYIEKGKQKISNSKLYNE